MQFPSEQRSVAYSSSLLRNLHQFFHRLATTVSLPFSKLLPLLLSLPALPPTPPKSVSHGFFVAVLPSPRAADEFYLRSFGLNSGLIASWKIFFFLYLDLLEQSSSLSAVGGSEVSNSETIFLLRKERSSSCFCPTCFISVTFHRS